MLYPRTSLFRLSIAALVVLTIQLSLSISPLLSQEVTIGTQIWTTKNLDVSTFRNGEAIPEAKSNAEWAKAGDNKTAAYCYYGYDSKNGKVYGKLYNWYAVNDSRGLAPKGYHIPSDGEWTILIDKLGGEKSMVGLEMRSTSGWSDGNNGNDIIGFNVLPGGFCAYNGYFLNVTEFGGFWSSSEFLTIFASYRYLKSGMATVYRNVIDKSYGFSVRCLRD
jgi:uncharacterized protein (TIGR02145 family)